MQINKNHIPQEVFNYQEYADFMESKKVRHGEDRTYTLLDFVTEEQRKQDRKNDINVNNLTPYNPTPKDIQEHFDFECKVFRELYDKYPGDKYLESLANDEDMQIERCSTDWYKKYGIGK